MDKLKIIGGFFALFHKLYKQNYICICLLMIKTKEKN